MFEQERDKIFNELGWTVDCECPFEISNDSGSIAIGEAAQIVQDYLIENYDNLKEEMS